jgi:hypothetical protein
MAARPDARPIDQLSAATPKRLVVASAPILACTPYRIGRSTVPVLLSRLLFAHCESEPT